jgi:hypothetical protein
MRTVIGRQYDQSGMPFKPLQQIGNFDIGMAVLGIFGFATFTKQRIGFIKTHPARPDQKL